jgi:RNA 3'-terminal phosphate cyclase (ATP)
LVLWAETDTNVVLGADAIGELRKTSETVGVEAAEKLFAEISAKPTVDVHLADLLVPYIALARSGSMYLTRAVTEHLQTNIWVAETILNVKLNITRSNELFKIERTG